MCSAYKSSVYFLPTHNSIKYSSMSVHLTSNGSYSNYVGAPVIGKSSHQIHFSTQDLATNVSLHLAVKVKILQPFRRSAFEQLQIYQEQLLESLAHKIQFTVRMGLIGTELIKKKNLENKDKRPQKITGDKPLSEQTCPETRAVAYSHVVTMRESMPSLTKDRQDRLNKVDKKTLRENEEEMVDIRKCNEKSIKLFSPLVSVQLCSPPSTTASLLSSANVPKQVLSKPNFHYKGKAYVYKHA